MTSYDEIEIVGEMPPILPQCISEVRATGAYLTPSVSSDTESRRTTPDQQGVEARAADRTARNGDMHADQLHAASQQLHGHAIFEGPWEGAGSASHDCTAQLAALRMINNEDSQHPGTSRGHKIASGEIRPTVRRRLHALAVMVSDGCH